MNIFLGHTTACIFWLTATQEQCDRTLPTYSLPSSLSARTPKTARLMAEGTVFAGSTLHVIVPDNCGAKSAEGVFFHYAKKTPGHYRRVSRDVFVASPELTFLQMAPILSFAELVLLGNDLCSRYYRNEFSPTGTSERKPLATPDSIQRLLESMGPFNGKANAQRALRFITPLAASPKEAEWATRFSLYHQYGGYGFPRFKCNFPIPIPKHMIDLTDRNGFKADFCWPKQKVIIEYDSDLHTGSEKIAADTMRRNFLVTKGYKVIGITRIQNNSEREMERVANEVRQALGLRKDIRCKKYPLKKQALARVCRQWAQTKPEQYLENR